MPMRNSFRSNRLAFRRSVSPKVRSVVLLLALCGSIGFYAFEKRTSRFADHVEGVAIVIDGDTLVVAGKHVRLVDIDAPEIDQTCGEDRSRIWLCGQSAAEAMKKHLANRTVRCQVRGYDRYHRLLGVCSLPDGSQINRWAVQNGWALAYSLGDTYEKEEREASAASRGIWASKFIRPSEWRAQSHHDAAFYTGD